MFTKQQVEQMNEHDLRRMVLIPLLRAMNYQDVQEYHGGREFGKDIVCWKCSDLGYRKNTALVVKAKAVSGKSKVDQATAGEIQTQINQCFGKPYLDPINSSSQTVHQCWVVSNHPISENAIDAIRSAMGNSVHKDNVDFVGIDKLWSLIEQYMPLQATLQKLEEVQQDFNTWDPHYRLEAHIGGSSIRHTIAEKFPGALQEKPIKIMTVFSFPDTPEGQELRKAMEHFFETGTPVKIPGAYIKSLEYSEFLQHVYPAITKDGFLEFGSVPNPKPLFLRCEILCDDGERFTVDFRLICTHAGMKEATLISQSQPVPISLELVLRDDTTVSSFHMALNYDILLNVHQLLTQAQCLRCLSKPHTIHFTNLETGMIMDAGSDEIEICNAPDTKSIEILEALDALQIKSGRLVFLPDREFTDEECKDLGMLHNLFLTGKLNATWSKSSASITVTDDSREEICQLLKPFEGGNTSNITIFQAHKLFLFGGEYPLGAIKPVVVVAKLANASEVEAFLDRGFSGELRLDYIPGDDGSVTLEYVNWLPRVDESPG